MYYSMDVVDSDLVNLDQKHERYLLAQRNLTVNDKDSILISFRKYYSSISNFLPEKCNSVLDIGCGLGITNLFVFEHYKRDKNIVFNLFDKTEYPDELYFGFKEKAAFYNDLDLAKNVLIDYGIAQNNINAIDAKKENLENLTDIDIVISSIAWGFHFPVSVYINEVVKLMHHESVLILDIRKGTNGLEELNNFFHCKKILEGKKSIRLVCSKK